jgi:long-chain acyl-CoA synthetase
VLQNELSRSDYIETAIVLAQSNWKRPGALVVPRFDRLSEYCRSKGIYAATREEIVREPTIRGLFQNEINQCVNGYFARHEHIGGFVLLSDSFQPGLELTETYKPKLRIIEEKYMKQIRELEMMVNT